MTGLLELGDDGLKALSDAAWSLDRLAASEDRKATVCDAAAKGEMTSEWKRYAALHRERADAARKDPAALRARPTPENGLREAISRLRNYAEHGVITPPVRADLRTVLSALQHNTGERDELPDDVRALVIAAREFWDIHDSPVEPESRALDQALEAFASRVPFADEPALSQAPR